MNTKPPHRRIFSYTRHKRKIQSDIPWSNIIEKWNLTTSTTYRNKYIPKEGTCILLRNLFTNYQAFIFLNSHFMPKLTHPFASTCCSSQQYNQLELKIISHAIAKMRYNHTWSLVLRYGSHQYGGLSLRNLATDALIIKILAIQSLIEKKECSRLIVIAF